MADIQQVGINQYPPSAPTHYPFLYPSADIDGLVADFYLSFPANTCQFAYPFRLAWVAGIGLTPSSPIPTYPISNHAYDILVRDDNDVDVFDSTDATTFIQHTYGLDLIAMEWRYPAANIFCRMVVRDDAAARTLLDETFLPGSAIFDSRTLQQLPLRVTSLIVNGSPIKGAVRFTEGFNVQIQSEQPTPAAGARIITNVNFRAVPGDGLGRIAGCEDVDHSFKTIGQVGPDAAGNVFLDLGECYRLQRPGYTSNGNPRQFSLGGSEFIKNVTDWVEAVPAEFLEDGETTRAALLSQISVLASSATQIYNDCAPCCECEQFITTYRGLKTIYEDTRDLAARTEIARNALSVGVAKWGEQKTCRENRPLRLVLTPGWLCRIQIGALFFNFSPCCLSEVDLRLTLQAFDGSMDAVGIADVIWFQRDTWRRGSDTGYVEVPLTFGSVHPNYDAHYDELDPYGSSSLRTVFKFPTCVDGWTLRVTLTAHSPNQMREDGITPCLPDVTLNVPADVRSIWGLTDNPTHPTRAWLQETVAISPDRGYTCS